MQTLPRKQSDMRLYDFVKEKIRSYLQRHHFTQVVAPDCVDDKKGLSSVCANIGNVKSYFFQQRCLGKKGLEKEEMLVFLVPCTPLPVLDAYVIAMVDRLFRDELKIECCVLHVMDHDDNRQALEEALMMLSTSFIGASTTSHSLNNAISVCTFSSRQLGEDAIFCTGERYGDCLVIHCSMEKTMQLVEQHKDIFILPQEPALSVVIPLSHDQHQLAALFASYLQQKGYCVDILFTLTSLADGIEKAGRMGARYALLIGPDEQKNSTVVARNLLTGDVRVIKQTDVPQLLLAEVR